MVVECNLTQLSIDALIQMIDHFTGAGRRPPAITWVTIGTHARSERYYDVTWRLSGYIEAAGARVRELQYDEDGGLLDMKSKPAEITVRSFRPDNSRRRRF